MSIETPRDVGFQMKDKVYEVGEEGVEDLAEDLAQRTTDRVFGVTLNVLGFASKQFAVVNIVYTRCIGFF